jgi:hypothetical protein
MLKSLVPLKSHNGSIYSRTQSMCYERVAKDREFPEDDGASLSGIEPAQIVTVIATVPTAMARCSLSIARPTRGVLPAVKDSKAGCVQERCCHSAERGQARCSRKQLPRASSTGSRQITPASGPQRLITACRMSAMYGRRPRCKRRNLTFPRIVGCRATDAAPPRARSMEAETGTTAISPRPTKRSGPFLNKS